MKGKADAAGARRIDVVPFDSANKFMATLVEAGADAGGGRAATEVAGARWVNVVLGNLKRAISGTYHAVKQAKYARRYLAEAAYRFNRRFRLRETLPRLATAMMRCKPCPEPRLRIASNFHG